MHWRSLTAKYVAVLTVAPLTPPQLSKLPHLFNGRLVLGLDGDDVLSLDEHWNQVFHFEWRFRCMLQTLCSLHLQRRPLWQPQPSGTKQCFLSSINSLPPKCSLGWAKHCHFFKCKKPLEDFSSNLWIRRVSDLAALSMSSSCTPTRMAAMPSEIFCFIIFLMAFPALRLGFMLEVLLRPECCTAHPPLTIESRYLRRHNCQDPTVMDLCRSSRNYQFLYALPHNFSIVLVNSKILQKLQSFF